jgi:signal transduction histidine kinase
LKKFLNKIKLKWRIFGYLLGFCVLLLIILWLFQVALLDDFYRRIRIAETRNDVAVIFEHLYDDDIYEIVAELSHAGDFNADIVNFDGFSLLNRFHTSRYVQENVLLIRSAQRNGGEFFQFNFTTSGSRRSSNLSEQPSGNQSGNRSNRQPSSGQSGGQSGDQSSGQSGSQSSSRRNQSRQMNDRGNVESFVYVRLADDRAVIINAVLTPGFATATTLLYQFYAISAIMIIFSAILAIIIAKRVSKPIEVINSSAKDLAKGHYDTRFTGKGFSEIVSLSETLNTAAVELGRAEALRRELLANVSHDLRTPISLIYSYAEMMHDFPEDITSEQIEVIMKETKRLTGLLNDVLDISKLEAGMEQPDITRFNLTANIGQTIEQLRELLVNQGYDITFTHGDDLYINADEMKIDRAFYNLLVNAVNFSGEDYKVLVDISASGTGVKVSVTDNGEGISEDDLPYIWDRYYKSGKAHKRAVIGTGLGLSIVKKIIDLHGGTYGVVSEVGKGSTFWFELEQRG